MADFVTTRMTPARIVFHYKSFPWFVSDVTERDFGVLLDAMHASTPTLKSMAGRWRGYLNSGRWSTTHHLFWTSGRPMAHLPVSAPDLFAQLTSAALTIWKGDLNYRKLVYDCGYEAWTRPFDFAALGYPPTTNPWPPVLALRTAKSDVVVGLEPGQPEQLDAKVGRNVGGSGWLVTGQYGLVQFTKNI
jgi:hypothetical protein